MTTDAGQRTAIGVDLGMTVCAREFFGALVPSLHELSNECKSLGLGFSYRAAALTALSASSPVPKVLNYRMPTLNGRLHMPPARSRAHLPDRTTGLD